MIYISSSCIKTEKISDAINIFLEEGVSNIELSGGTHYYDGLIDDLLMFKQSKGVDFLLHNYFPPPIEPFVLNLASNDPVIAQKSLEHLNSSIKLSGLLGADKFAFHAGFMIDPAPQELGRRILSDSTQSMDVAMKNFILNYQKIHAPNTKLYIENNVVSSANFLSFGYNPFMLVDADDFMALQSLFNFNLLLDVAHLKVSCCVLNKDFNTHLEKLLQHTDYIHLSDNDGKSDQNLGIHRNSELYSILRNNGLKGKTVTIEVYQGMKEVLETGELIEALL